MGGSQAQCWVDCVEQLARAVGMVTAFGGLRQHGLEIQLTSDFSPTANHPQYQRHLFVHISQHCPSPGAPPLESVDVRQIYDKFPEKKGGLRELYDRGPPHAFFLVKFWADLNWGPSGEEAGAGGSISSGGFYGVSSQYESLEHMTLTCSSKVCSFGKQVVEKVEVRLEGWSSGAGERPATQHLGVQNGPEAMMTQAFGSMRRGSGSQPL